MSSRERQAKFRRSHPGYHKRFRLGKATRERIKAEARAMLRALALADAAAATPAEGSAIPELLTMPAPAPQPETIITEGSFAA